MKTLILALVLIGCSHAPKVIVPEVSSPEVVYDQEPQKKHVVEPDWMLKPFKEKKVIVDIQGTFLEGKPYGEPSVVVFNGKRFKYDDLTPEQRRETKFCAFHNEGMDNKFLVGQYELDATLAGRGDYGETKLWTVQFRIDETVRLVCVGPQRFTLKEIKEELGDIILLRE